MNLELDPGTSDMILIVQLEPKMHLQINGKVAQREKG